MSFVVTLEDFRPSPRYDATAWTDARIEEGATAAGPWVALETIALSPLDADPSDPAYRNFTTELGTAADLWYRIVFLDVDADEALPTFPVQNTSATQPMYSTSGELARVLSIRTPSSEQRTALDRVLAAASRRIDSEIDMASTDSLEASEIALAEHVCLGYAAELWKFQEVQFGLVGVGSEIGATYVPRDLWEKWAIELEPLKRQFGFA